MTKIAIAPDDWVVVCDGRKWLILQNKGDAGLPNLITREQRKTDNPPTHEQGTDRPGRVSGGTGRSHAAVGQTDWHDQGEQDFLTGLAAHLDKAVQESEVRGIVLVAPPRALGMIRPQLSAAVAGLVHDEVDKDYTNMPVDQIERLLSG